MRARPLHGSLVCVSMELNRMKKTISIIAIVASLAGAVLSFFSESIGLIIASILPLTINVVLGICEFVSLAPLSRRILTCTLLLSEILAYPFVAFLTPLVLSDLVFACVSIGCTGVSALLLIVASFFANSNEAIESKRRPLFLVLALLFLVPTLGFVIGESIYLIIHNSETTQWFVYASIIVFVTGVAVSYLLLFVFKNKAFAFGLLLLSVLTVQTVCFYGLAMLDVNNVSLKIFQYNNMLISYPFWLASLFFFALYLEQRMLHGPKCVSYPLK